MVLGLGVLGSRVALDDFGAGYGSLTYVTRLPIDALKIDQGFVQRLPRLAKHESLVQAAIALANSLGINVVAASDPQPWLGGQRRRCYTGPICERPLSSVLNVWVRRPIRAVSDGHLSARGRPWRPAAFRRPTPMFKRGRAHTCQRQLHRREGADVHVRLQASKDDDIGRGVGMGE